MSEAKNVQHWQAMAFRDADTMTAYLEAIGFTEHAVYRDGSDPRTVVHAEYVGHGGGVMFGSVRPDASVDNVGRSAAYLVVADPASVQAAAIAAGATETEPVTGKDYGGSGGSVVDPEGNHWSFGDYQPGADA